MLTYIGLLYVGYTLNYSVKIACPKMFRGQRGAHTYRNTYIDTYAHKYIHTYIHAHIPTYIQKSKKMIFFFLGS